MVAGQLSLQQIAERVAAWVALTGSLIQAVYPEGSDVDPSLRYWQLKDGRRAYANGNAAYPYLVEFHTQGGRGRYGQTQLLISYDPDLPDVAFIFGYSDYYATFSDPTGNHPDRCAFIVDRTIIEALVKK